VLPVVELIVDEPTARTTWRLLPYAKKFAAEKKDTPVFATPEAADVLAEGCPNTDANSFSVVTSVLFSAGPHWKSPTNAPAVVDTEGTTVVKSTSDTFTPGEI
jgi:hypothetical protein